MRFSFAGVEYEGFEGETLAAALVRNGMRAGFSSIYRRRPRGVFSAHEEEPNALVQIEGEPLVRATLVELVEGLKAEPCSGKGRLMLGAATRFDGIHTHCDVLIIGAGASGRSAAASSRGRVVVLDQFRTDALDGITVLERTTALGIYDDNYVIAASSEGRLLRIRAKRVILATGALERPPVFEENDRPGIMLSSAVDTYGVHSASDIIPVSGGWSPRVHLWSQAGGRLRWDDRIDAPVPDGELSAVECVGKVTGAGLADAPQFELPVGDEDLMFVDLERDATVADIRRAIGAGLRSVEHLKRYTSIGTGSDQGKTSSVNATRVAAKLLAIPPAELGTTTFRPPYVSISFAHVAGRFRSELYEPTRTTPMHAWHVARDAVFENVGQWKRPRYYPLQGEEMEQAVLRECAAARESVAIMDASTLGKIDLQGPDSVEFLNRLYTNSFDSLAVGRCRYALMCTSDGMLFDDGVVMRVDEQRFVCTTTTGNAAAVYSWMEEWHQTEWSELRVWLSSVTEQWAAVAVVGPDSRELLARVTSIPLDRAEFRFMDIRAGEVAGIPARVCRISFSGELAFEINVDARYGATLWSALVASGNPTPYGTETTHVLRAEKGYPIIGQETDGTVTPFDLGMDWMVAMQKQDFIGKRSFTRIDTARLDRKQLVGLLPVETRKVLPEGAQLILEPTLRVPATSIGHVTSSYLSATVGRSFALALVERGRERHGEVIHAVPPRGAPIAVRVAEPILYDKEGLRRDGRPN